MPDPSATVFTVAAACMAAEPAPFAFTFAEPPRYASTVGVAMAVVVVEAPPPRIETETKLITALTVELRPAERETPPAPLVVTDVAGSRPLCEADLLGPMWAATVALLVATAIDPLDPMPPMPKEIASASAEPPLYALTATAPEPTDAPSSTYAELAPWMFEFSSSPASVIVDTVTWTTPVWAPVPPR